jgi:hypothetical protein
MKINILVWYIYGRNSVSWGEILLKIKDVLEKLRKYSFDYIMSLSEIIAIKEYSYFNKKELIFPHELEIFIMLSILSCSETDNMVKISRSEFFEIVNTIKKFTPKAYSIEPKNLRFLIANILINQLNIQQDFLINFYRYNYIFNFINERIDMKQLFINKFGIEYTEVLSIGMFFCICSIHSAKLIDKEILFRIKEEYPITFALLSIDRLEFIKKQWQLLNNDIENCMLGFKLIFQYPFILEDNKIYYPLQYAIKDSCTSSLLYRLTEGDNEIRTRIGKEVLEEYLYHIHTQINIYNEVQKEFIYYIGKDEQKPPDLMLRKDNYAVLLDIKSSVPSLKFRELNLQKRKEVIDKMADNVVQIYKNIQKFNSNSLSFQSGVKISLENTFGIVVILEDNYLDREEILTIACEKLRLPVNSENYNYVHSNIKILNLYEIEILALDSTSIIDVLKFIKDDPSKWYDVTFRGMDFNWARETSKDYKNFKSFALSKPLVIAKSIGLK